MWVSGVCEACALGELLTCTVHMLSSCIVPRTGAFRGRLCYVGQQPADKQSCGFATRLSLLCHLSVCMSSFSCFRVSEVGMGLRLCTGREHSLGGVLAGLM